jgi:hypothetical protein
MGWDEDSLLQIPSFYPLNPFRILAKNLEARSESGICNALICARMLV